MGNSPKSIKNKVKGIFHRGENTKIGKVSECPNCGLKFN